MPSDSSHANSGIVAIPVTGKDLLVGPQQRRDPGDEDQRAADEPQQCHLRGTRPDRYIR
jgi:hypothetical protein